MELEDVRHALIKYVGKDYLPGLGEKMPGFERPQLTPEQIKRITDILNGLPARKVPNPVQQGERDAEVEVQEKEEPAEAEA